MVLSLSLFRLRAMERRRMVWVLAVWGLGLRCWRASEPRARGVPRGAAQTARCMGMHLLTLCCAMPPLLLMLLGCAPIW